MKLQYRLRTTTNKAGQQEIQVVYNHASTRIEFGTGVHTFKDDFVNESNRVKLWQDPNGEKLNKIKLVYDKVHDLVQGYWKENGLGNNYPKPKDLKIMYEGEKKVEVEKSLIQAFTVWYEKKTIRKGSEKLFTTIFNDLKDVLGKNYPMEKVSRVEMEKLKQYWLGKNLANPTILKRFRTFKKFLDDNDVEGDWRKFKIELGGYTNDVNLFSLERAEYDALMNYDFSGFSVNQQYAINLFLLACNTGLRINDARKFAQDRANLYPKNGQTWIRTTIRKKDDKMLTYPLSKSALKIIDRLTFDNNLSEQKIRDNLATVFDKIKDEMPETWVEITQHWKITGNTPKHSYEPKYKLLTFHSGRKTFATIFLPVLGPQTVSEVGGWSDMNVMLRRYASKKNTENLALYTSL